MSNPASTPATAIGAACLAVVALLTVATVAADGPTSLDQALTSWVAQHCSPEMCRRYRSDSSPARSLDHDQADEDKLERLWSEETERRMAQLASGEDRTVSRDAVREGLAALRAERSA
ncbi:MAG: hypothetical protein JWM47_250 [Acidimicrobiales bacterium]|nr:hypothetical protein [Acidimicrobiales bacterium]